MPEMEPLTIDNLDKHTSQTSPKESWHQIPCSVTGAAKTGMFLPQYRLYRMLQKVDRIGQVGDRIRRSADVILMDGEFYFLYETDPPLDLDDYTTWHMLWSRFEHRFGRILRREVAKLDLRLCMRSVERQEKRGRRVLDADELYISRKGRICCKREFARWNDVGDPKYWEGKVVYFRRVNDKLIRGDGKGNDWYDTRVEIEQSPREGRNECIETWLSTLEIGDDIQ